MRWLKADLGHCMREKIRVAKAYNKKVRENSF
jgi:hypothetical protein